MIQSAYRVAAVQRMNPERRGEKEEEGQTGLTERLQLLKIITLFNCGERKSVSECTTCQSLKQMGHNRRPRRGFAAVDPQKKKVARWISAEARRWSGQNLASTA